VVGFTETDLALTVNATVSFDANLSANGVSGYQRNFRPGELFAVADGMRIAALFGRHNQGSIPGVYPIDISTWKNADERESPLTVFGKWRLKIDIDGLEPIYWTPEFGSSPDAES